MSTNEYVIILDKPKRLTAVYVEILALSADAGGPYTGTPDSAIQFACTPLGGVAPYTFLWNFGDGATSVLQNPTHAYTAEGTFTVSLQVTDSNSPVETANDTATATISSLSPPVASFTSVPASPTTTDQITFNGSGSYPQQSGATITNYDWNFGDGATASGVNTTHQYATAGSYNVVLTVTDSNGLTDTEPKTIVVTQGVVTISLNVTAGTGGTVSPSGTQSLTVGVAYQFFATPATGFDMLNWDLGGENKGSSETLILTVTQDMSGKTLTALFTTEPLPPVNVTIAVSGSGLTDISGPQVFHEGDVVTITAIPQSGATFNGWKLDGSDYSSQNPLELTVTADLNGKTLTADFTTLIQAGFPLWILIPVGAGALGVGALLLKGDKHKRK